MHIATSECSETYWNQNFNNKLSADERLNQVPWADSCATLSLCLQLKNPVLRPFPACGPGQQFGSLKTLALQSTMQADKVHRCMLNNLTHLKCALAGFLRTCTRRRAPCSPRPCSNRSSTQDSCDGSLSRSGPKKGDHDQYVVTFHAKSFLSRISI